MIKAKRRMIQLYVGGLNVSHYHFSDEISGSDNIIIAKLIPSAEASDYQFRRAIYPNIHIPNRGLALHLSFLEDDSKEVQELRALTEEYNEYLTKIEAIPGFVEYFKQHGFCVSKKEVSDQWSVEIADLVFSKGTYCFSTDLHIVNDCLFDCHVPGIYQTTIMGEDITIPVEKLCIEYPDMINGKKAIWNWVDNGHDLCYFLWMLLGERYSQYEVSDDEESDEDDNTVRYHFAFYDDETRDQRVEPQLINIFRKLESLGYIESYTIKPEHEDPRWFDYGKTDETIDVALIDTSFLKNSLVMEQIELLLWQREEDIIEGQCFLTDRNGKQYISDHLGALGGHCGLKIYGKLQCIHPAANRFIPKGQYVKQRVFFEDEETAIAAGYSPCRKCMPEAYKRWKSDTEQ